MTHIPTDRSQQGSALIVAVAVAFAAAALAYSALSVSTSEHRALQRAPRATQARYLAEGGVHRALQWARETMAKSYQQPLEGIDQLIFDDPRGERIPKLFVIARDEPLTKNGRRYGTFTVTVTGSGAGETRDLVVTSTGYVPNSANPQAKVTVESVVRAGLGTSEMFDYAYVVDNWGWLNDSSITVDGNVRANGQFDAGSAAPTVNGTSRYEDVQGTNLMGRLDDNGDGLENDGGVYSGWDVLGAEYIQGMGGDSSNQHEMLERLELPNLSNLAQYEQQALDEGAGIYLGQPDGSWLQVCDGVLGDDPAELSHVALIGTPDQPIRVDGPVVVRGDVVIKGTVTGQGSIYASGNIYVPDNLTYLNGPTSELPASQSEADTEAWLAANQGADFLGLFATENLVLGDFLDQDWRMSVAQWLMDPRNSSREDAGQDGIPYTEAGRDGVLGTEDDDLLDMDGEWTVEYYTHEDDLLGLIPPGFVPGDAIPGSGEDLDGDGRFDDHLTLAEFDLSAALDPANWAGNLPAGLGSYSDLAGMAVTRVDGALYSAHAAAMASFSDLNGDGYGDGNIVFYGSIASRNESLLSNAASLRFVHDRRLAGGGLYGPLLPRVAEDLEIVAWRVYEGGDAALDIQQ